ncbi:uncharacterized protein RAG0_06741 [Rhynchosporium agropyri]|uniref:Uncharacterized protein n=1 Tax=Rhynchosporium agropyri TaxID=914238 RepID=A0A1E1KIH1_9HELO|nr:uncharacterized protein RAG0_06741 [Rhynchosporium agropyri]
MVANLGEPHGRRRSSNTLETLPAGIFVPEVFDSNEEGEREHYRSREHQLIAPFNFSSLAEDGSTAIFSVDTASLTDELQPKARQRLRFDLSQSMIEQPQHTVQIRRDVNDGPIPGLSMDYEKLELSCNWRELYAAFYNEEYLYHIFTRKALKKRGPWLEGLKAQVDRGQLDPMAVMTKALTAFADDSKVCRKLARRARICWQYKKHDGTEWDFGRDGDEDTERNCLAELQNVRHFSSMEIFSDEESGEDDEEEEEDSEADGAGEWDDTDSDDN